MILAALVSLNQRPYLRVAGPGDSLKDVYRLTCHGRRNVQNVRCMTLLASATLVALMGSVAATAAAGDPVDVNRDVRHVPSENRSHWSYVKPRRSELP